jgi:DNA adenine methylase
MWYMGGKARLAKHIAEIIGPGIPLLVEPFVGGFNIVPAVRPQRAICADVHVGLIGMYRAIQAGWIPPQEYSEAKYHRLQATKAWATPLHTFVSFACSFGGKEWGGFARYKKGCSCPEQCRMPEHKMLWINRTEEFLCRDYSNLAIPSGATVYCDPPYQGVTAYKTGAFDPVRFVAWCNQQADRGCRVLVSEFINLCPDRWRIVWQKTRKIQLTEQQPNTVPTKTELLLEVQR